MHTKEIGLNIPYSTQCASFTLKMQAHMISDDIKIY